MALNKDKTICFGFKGVIKYSAIEAAIPHAIPMLYRQFNKYKHICIWDEKVKPEEISKWLQHHDMEWRECCERIVRDMNEDVEDRKKAKETLLHPPLLPRIYLPKYRPECDVYVKAVVPSVRSDGTFIISVIQSAEVYETW